MLRKSTAHRLLVMKIGAWGHKSPGVHGFPTVAAGPRGFPGGQSGLGFHNLIPNPGFPQRLPRDRGSGNGSCLVPGGGMWVEGARAGRCFCSPTLDFQSLKVTVPDMQVPDP